MRRIQTLPLLLVLLLAFPLAPGALASEDAVQVTTDHYVLTAETTREEAEAFGRVLEAAWPKYEAFFGKAPRLEKGGRLPVVFCATREGFVDRLRRDGVTPPDAGGYYHLGNRTAYAWRQPTRYYTRCLLLHEVLHQFHYLSRTDNGSTLQGWYVEGLAEVLSRHTWDGETLVMGVVPPLSLKDYPREALAALSAEGADLERLLAKDGLSRSAAWAVVRYLVAADGGKHRKKFEKMAKKLDRGSTREDLLFRTFGKPAKLREALLRWLPEVQEPWAQVFNEWEGIAPGCFRGTAPGGVVSACRIKAETTSIAATFDAPEEGPWLAGLLLSYTGSDDYTVALLSNAGQIRVHRRHDGAWQRVQDLQRTGLVKQGAVRFEATRSGGEITLHIGGEKIGTFDLPGDTFGLAMQGGVANFRDVRWR